MQEALLMTVIYTCVDVDLGYGVHRLPFVAVGLVGVICFLLARNIRNRSIKIKDYTR